MIVPVCGENKCVFQQRVNPIGEVSLIMNLVQNGNMDGNQIIVKPNKL